MSLSLGKAPRRVARPGAAFLLRFMLAGTWFGFLLCKSEVVSWYRMQEMFHFQGLPMFGLFATAIPVGMLSLWALRRFGARSLDGEMLSWPDKAPGWRSYLFGGLLFGLGWGLTGACPGPIFTLIGGGFGGMLVVLASALLGTWTYGWLRPRLPH